jgi:hypothetical protein
MDKFLQSYSPQTSRDTLNRKSDMARMLMQTGGKAENPYINLLANVVGGYQMGRVNKEVDDLNRQEIELEKQMMLRKAQMEEQEAMRQQANLDREFALRQEQGRLGGDENLPSSVREYQFYQNLDDEGKRNFMNVKRASQSFDLGNQYAFIDPLTRQINQTIPKDLTKGDQKVDEAFATDFNEFISTGGFGDVEKGINQIGGALSSLREGEVETGGITGFLEGKALSVANPKLQQIKEAVEEVVQRNLKSVLGGAFTEKEGDKLISRAFNPTLSTEFNIERLERLQKAMVDAYEMKKANAEYFQKNGTLKGSPFKQLTITDIEKMIDGETGNKQQSSEIKFLGFE